MNKRLSKCTDWIRIRWVSWSAEPGCRFEFSKMAGSGSGFCEVQNTETRLIYSGGHNQSFSFYSVHFLGKSKGLVRIWGFENQWSFAWNKASKKSAVRWNKRFQSNYNETIMFFTKKINSNALFSGDHLRALGWRPDVRDGRERGVLQPRHEGRLQRLLHHQLPGSACQGGRINVEP